MQHSFGDDRCPPFEPDHEPSLLPILRETPQSPLIVDRVAGDEPAPMFDCTDWRVLGHQHARCLFLLEGVWLCLIQEKIVDAGGESVVDRFVRKKSGLEPSAGELHRPPRPAQHHLL